nr:hypothetical protein CFP56_42819 [Quercus suber]
MALWFENQFCHSFYGFCRKGAVSTSSLLECQDQGVQDRQILLLSPSHQERVSIFSFTATALHIKIKK